MFSLVVCVISLATKFFMGNQFSKRSWHTLLSYETLTDWFLLRWTVEPDLERERERERGVTGCVYLISKLVTAQSQCVLCQHMPDSIHPCTWNLHGSKLTAYCSFLLPMASVKIHNNIFPGNSIFKMTCHLHTTSHPSFKRASVSLHRHQNITEDGIQDTWWRVHILATALFMWLIYCCCVKNKVLSCKKSEDIYLSKPCMQTVHM